MATIKAPTIFLANGKRQLTSAPHEYLTFTWNEGTATDNYGDPIPGTRYAIYRRQSAFDPAGAYDEPDVTAPYGGDRTAQFYSPDEADTQKTYFLYLEYPSGYGGYRRELCQNLVVVNAIYVGPNSPVSLQIEKNVTIAGATVSLNWSESTPGQNSIVSGYRVEICTDGINWSALKTVTGLTTDITAPATSGTYNWYRVIAVGEWAASESIPSNTVELLANTPPTTPTVRTGSAGKTYNPKPRILVTVGTDEDPLTISASGFSPSRSTNIGSGHNIVLKKDANASVGESSVIVSVTDPYGESASVTASYEYDIPIWTDDPVIAGTTLIKAAHINELRNAFDNICDYYGLTKTIWTNNPIVAGETSSSLFPIHAAQLQNTATRIAQFLNLWDGYSTTNNVVLPAFTDPNAARAAVINELRDCVTLL